MNLDLRSKLAVFLSTVFLASVLSKDAVFFLLIAMLFLYLFASGYGKFLMKIFIAIAIVTVLRIISNGQGLGLLLPEMFLFIIMRTLAIILSVFPIIKTPPGEMMAIMRKLKIHRNIALPLVFMLRFLPVVKHEFKEIIASLKLRGLISFKKPLLTMEYLFVPMMFSASKISEELAASSEVRGLSANGLHTSRREIKLRKTDILVVFMTLFITVTLYYMEGKASL